MPDGVLIFDMDGVLVDVTGSYRETIRQTVRYFTGREIENERIQDLKNAGGWTNDWAVSHRVIEDLGFDVDYGTVVAQFQTIFLGQGDDGLMQRERWVARPGLLEGLSQRYDLAVFTGRTRQEARLTLDQSQDAAPTQVGVAKGIVAAMGGADGINRALLARSGQSTKGTHNEG